jgi:Holliday junction resolvase RusA-like endonuclease
MIFSIPGDPIPQARPRFCMQGRKPIVRDPNRADKIPVRLAMKQALFTAMNSDIQHIALDACGLATSDTYSVEMHFRFATPKSWSDKKSRSKINQPHNSKPDIDNLIKFYLDCASGILWLDDRMVTQIMASKAYGLSAQTIITVTAQNTSKLSDGEGIMDKQIHKVQKDLKSGHEGKAKKDLSTLLKMDKKQDAKIEKCDMKKPMKKKK